MPDEFAERRKVLLREALLRAARALLAHVREHEVPPAALVIQLGSEEIVAIGTPSSVHALTRPAG